MKKYIAIIVAVVSIVIWSCNKDEDGTSPIVGTWTLDREETVDCDDPADNYYEDYTCTDTDCIKITFKSNGKVTFSGKEDGISISFEGTYSTTANYLTICVMGDCASQVQYSITGSTLTLTSEADLGCTSITVLKK